ncbi:MAG: hypothetical protein EBR23_14710 [Planctomycetia bacterium]|nr:hypothetical protein [Planctomycetia bacterium]
MAAHLRLAAAVQAPRAVSPSITKPRGGITAVTAMEAITMLDRPTLVVMNRPIWLITRAVMRAVRLGTSVASRCRLRRSCGGSFGWSWTWASRRMVAGATGTGAVTGDAERGRGDSSPRASGSCTRRSTLKSTRPKPNMDSPRRSTE